MTSIQPELWVDRAGAAVGFYEAAFARASFIASVRETTSSRSWPSATPSSGSRRLSRA